MVAYRESDQIGDWRVKQVRTVPLAATPALSSTCALPVWRAHKWYAGAQRSSQLPATFGGDLCSRQPRTSAICCTLVTYSCQRHTYCILLLSPCPQGLLSCCWVQMVDLAHTYFAELITKGRLEVADQILDDSVVHKDIVWDAAHPIAG